MATLGTVRVSSMVACRLMARFLVMLMMAFSIARAGANMRVSGYWRHFNCLGKPKA